MFLINKELLFLKMSSPVNEDKKNHLWIHYTDDAVKSMKEQIWQLIDNTIQLGQYQQKYLSNKQGNF